MDPRTDGYFFDPVNWEILIKVSDGDSANGHYWCTEPRDESGMRDPGEDTTMGTVKEYRNQPGRPAAAITDNKAFRRSYR